MKYFYYFTIPLLALGLAAACNKTELREQEETFSITVGLSETGVKTTMGASNEGKRKVYWSDGDRLALNGSASDALTGLAPETASASFTFHGSFSSPYKLLYPASFYKDATTITLPATQSWVDGTVAPDTAPLACQVLTPEGSASIQHLCTIVYLRVRKNAGVSASKLVSVKFSGNADEQVCGDFTIDYATPSLTPVGTGSEVAVTLNESLSESEDLDIYMVVPATTYASGFSVTMEDEFHRTMTKTKPSSTLLEAGKMAKMSAFEFVPSALATEFTIEDVEEEVLPLDGYNVTGRVVSSTGDALENVVVTDGLQCVRTMSDGTFYMHSAVPGTKFVYVSSPSGYMPAVSGGIPRFYKLLSDVTPSGGIYDFGDFVMTPVANPNRFTLLITADPQPRKYARWNNDRIAFRSLDACEDLYDELADVAAGITGRQVYGICLGDIVHEDMTLFDNYDAGLARLGYPTYNIIGNHDNDPEASDDDSGAAPFESHYGPRNYSFNIGGIHFVMLDNLIMKDNGEGALTSFNQGLTDEIWAWLQADLSFVPTSTKLMVCAHSPMFKYISGSERTNTAAHGPDYGNLINDYAEIHAWAGHTHVGFNYNYPSSHRHKRVQVHTLARSTGELWTNEYLASGTPRGLTIGEVDNGEITWRFPPVTRHTGSFMGVASGICSAGAPSYTWRDWNYDGAGFAVMKDGSGALTEEYQLHVYPRGAYGDDYVYANVFLWDDKWGVPTWTPDGGAPVTMTLVNSCDGANILDTGKIHDLGTTEFKTHYKANVGFFGEDDGYPASELGEITTLFRAPASASPNSGTVSVTDRFGNVYTRKVSW